jgi:hypothetical protein
MSNIWLFFLVQNLVLLVHFSDKCCTLKYFFITTHWPWNGSLGWNLHFSLKEAVSILSSFHKMYSTQVINFKFRLFNNFLKTLMSSSHEVLNLKAHGWNEDCYCIKIKYYFCFFIKIKYYLLYFPYTEITHSCLCFILLEWNGVFYLSLSIFLSEVCLLCILCYKKLAASSVPVRYVKFSVTITEITNHLVCKEKCIFFMYKNSLRT